LGSDYILDASVAAKWLLPSEGETLAEQALGILEDFANGRVRLFVPDLFWPEVANLLWKAVRRGRMPEPAAAAAIRSLSGLGLPTIPSASLVNDALSIALRFDRTAYDATYVALAVRSRRSLVTADERLVHALAAHFPVLWLGGHEFY
jgi:predicted nucleic acid-binding protein